MVILQLVFLQLVQQSLALVILPLQPLALVKLLLKGIPQKQYKFFICILLLCIQLICLLIYHFHFRLLVIQKLIIIKAQAQTYFLKVFMAIILLMAILLILALL